MQILVYYDKKMYLCSKSRNKTTSMDTIRHIFGILINVLWIGFLIAVCLFIIYQSLKQYIIDNYRKKINDNERTKDEDEKRKEFIKKRVYSYKYENVIYEIFSPYARKGGGSGIFRRQFCGSAFASLKSGGQRSSLTPSRCCKRSSLIRKGFGSLYLHMSRPVTMRDSSLGKGTIAPTPHGPIKALLLIGLLEYAILPILSHISVRQNLGLTCSINVSHRRWSFYSAFSPAFIRMTSGRVH